MSLWHYQADIENFSDDTQVSDERRKEIIDIMLSDKHVKYWNYGTLLRKLLDHIDAELGFKIVTHYVNNGKSYAFDCNSDYSIITKLYEMYPDKDKVKDLIRTSKSKRVNRALLALDGISVEDEVVGLRALSGLTYAPDFLYTEKYMPSLGAIKKLPPVMRLSALETLLNNNHMSYNIFGNFTNPDEFKSLLFGAVLRHRERAESVWKKYNEINSLGKEATVVLSYECSNCGNIDISIKSVRARTDIGLSNTRLGAFLDYNNCPLCGRWGDDIKKGFKCIESE